MIGYLKGEIVGIYKTTSNRVFVTVDVRGVGYEVQIPPRWLADLPAVGESVCVFTHLQVREDQLVFYGFASQAQRDVFRQLVSVSGIGSQLAIALLDTLDLPELVGAIVSADTSALMKTPGVGKKTAERIALELKSKLAAWREQAGLSVSLTPQVDRQLQEDLEMTLLALGYSTSEVSEAIAAIASEPELSGETPIEQWLKRAIAWLSDNA
ncbi:Holliday junction branch migration protein RuvA [Oxynema aestuarii]|uniref:Holliday junction branch migration complex subunit RuvA n=1 Tax=Oxynema aestuarii AP17 TaxID=2064643 RepID=A0A6H1TU73_9CYAN|nr:Holliday junction branch migration protein RuvA [Oxynema aestuarii]QIZ70101.1 Holliday junction branch migration protein RuvA [Oxynema aestuarii AP17]